MNYYDAKKAIGPFINNGRKYLPSELLTNDWRVQSGVYSVKIYSVILDIQLYITNGVYSEMIRKNPLIENRSFTFTTFGWLSETDLFFAEDTVEEAEQNKIPLRSIKKFSLYQDILGDKYFITKEKIKRTYFSLGIHKTYFSNYPIFSVSDKQEILEDKSCLGWFGPKSILSANSLKKTLFSEEINLSDLGRERTKRNLLMKNSFQDKNLISSFESSTDIFLRKLDEDYREYKRNSSQEEQEISLVEELKYVNYSLLFVVNENYVPGRNFDTHLENLDGTLYVNRTLLESRISRLKYLKVKDLAEFKRGIQDPSVNLNHLVDHDELFDFNQVENHYILPCSFIGN